LKVVAQAQILLQCKITILGFDILTPIFKGYPHFKKSFYRTILLGSFQIKIKWVGYIPSPIFFFLGEKFQTIAKELNFFFTNLIIFLIKTIKNKMISQKNITVFSPIFYTWFK
jgi:hypothetical protein